METNTLVISTKTKFMGRVSSNGLTESNTLVSLRRGPKKARDISLAQMETNILENLRIVWGREWAPTNGQMGLFMKASF